jgi:hypothetical protein
LGTRCRGHGHSSSVFFSVVRILSFQTEI